MRLPVLAVTALMMGAPAFAQDATSPIIGGWRMTALMMTQDDGTTITIPYSGQLIFTEAGTLSVQAMDADPDAAPTTYTANAYEAYYGPVAIDDQDGTFTITVESSLVRDLIGQELTRVWTVEGDQLTIGPVDSSEPWRVTYDRM
ncbi:MAG: lipocalin-like domain-containing protein [Paracoccus sp. (in: a-proteobacteria)]|uniref:lipocalin-like domain-containing protein n=1 Tax=Paracoccus sp. TaxID=267 RepID=UPI0026DF6002|nr:lipocalin-like domain-containing protein [Paracoccus sp. (in: a-proteobacteria)]MDO5613329.1 lipocalin-like domain-containing protein [Paracoccus sp. (in: a-proteobacteria)]